MREAVKNWDDAFKAAGSSLSITLDESFDVELGDLRYNAINVIENLTASIFSDSVLPSQIHSLEKSFLQRRMYI